MNKGEQFEKNVREYYSNRSDVLEVFRDTYGKTDIAVIFKDRVYLIECKETGILSSKEQEQLVKLSKETEDNFKVRVRYLEDSSKSKGISNSSYTKIRGYRDIERHKVKLNE